jgi:hypothetical protein
MSGGGFTLPRIRIRSRRRKPRGPEWKRKALHVALDAFFVVVYAPTAWAVAVGFTICLAVDWRDLHRAPCDPEARPLTLREEITGALAVLAALSLVVVGVVGLIA